ncbi:MAG: glycosyltransferase [Xenococcus sp. MO_188.B8]|nr:glycosyltransferase [Xenococcus sp. MO_188.B8]
MTSVTPKRAIVTICSGNYFPYARILFTSLQQYHPEASLFLCLADKLQPDGELGIEGVEVIPAADLAITNFADFAFRYDIMEFNTAVKPFVMQDLIENRGFEEVVYLDPDIELFAPMSPVFEAFAKGADFVLTPHITEPAEFGEFPDDIGIMKAGIYNLGFIAVNNSLDGISFLHWWGRRLRFQCVNRQSEGIFVDQKFVDLLPSFHDNVAILRDRSLNVAYWNLDQRELTKTDEGWLVNGQPLRFFHFSGISTKAPHQLSKHTSRFRENLTPALQEIILHYIDKLKYFGFGSTANPEYGYARFNNGIAIADMMRRCYRDTEDLFLENPFDSFADYLNQPSQATISNSPWLITNLMYHFWSEREDLQQAFDLNHPESRHNYGLWFVQNAPSYGIDAYFINPVLDNVGYFYANQIKLNPQRFGARKADVGVIGYLKAETGVGNAGRMVASSFYKSQVNTQGYNVTLNVMARQAETQVDDILASKIDSRVEIYNVNADQLGVVRKHLAGKTNENAYKINMPFWELSKFPTAWVNNYLGIHEVWAPSRFVQAAVQTAMTLPVIWMPPAVTLDQFTPRDRSYFKLPEHTFLFHFNFDFSSFATRKNAIAGIEAYRLAFRGRPNNTPTALAIKTRGYDPDGKNLQKLIDFTADEPDIYILNEEMAYSDAMALMNCCDCYLSLHRSEGFGFTPAEAMLLEKPVIATDYSGTRDFIDSTTGFPVSYRLISVKENEYPFWESQQWADPNLDHAAWLMRKIVSDLTHTKQVSLAGKQRILSEYSPEHVGQLYKQRLQQIGII